MAKFKVGQVFEGMYPPEAAIWCNSNGAHIEVVTDGKGKYKIVENEVYVPSDAEVLAQKETEYKMDRVTREGILGNPDAYSEFNVNRAKELEELAAKVRQPAEGE